MEFLVSSEFTGRSLAPVEKLSKFSPQELVNHQYKPHERFCTPVFVRGTKVQLVPNREAIVLNTSSKSALDRAIQEFSDVEERISVVSISELSHVHLVCMDSSKMIFQNSGKFYALSVPRHKYIEDGELKESDICTDLIQLDLPYKQVHKLFGIPCSFTLKCSDKLVSAIVGEWEERWGGCESSSVGVNLLFLKDEIELDITDCIRTEFGDDTLNSIQNPATIPCFQVVNFLKSSRSKIGQKTVHENGTLGSTLVSFGLQLLNLSVEGSRVIGSEAELQEVAPAFYGANKGVHFARMVFGNEVETQDGMIYRPSISVNADYGGITDRDMLGTVWVNFGLFRDHTNSDLIVGIPESEKNRIRDEFVKYELLRESSIGDVNGRLKNDLEAAFSTVYGRSGFRCPIVKANWLMGSGDRTVELAIRAFWYVVSYHLDSLFTTEVYLSGLNNDLVIRELESKSVEYDFNPEMLKYMIIQYLSCSLIGLGDEGGMYTVSDLIRFVTFIAQSYDTVTQSKMCKVLMEYGNSVKRSLSNDDDMNARSNFYKAMIQL